MIESRPIMCTHSAGELEDRGKGWQKLLASGLVERERVPGGSRLSAQPGASQALLRLIDLERECCAWMDYDVEGSVVTLTAAGEGERILAGMFVV